MADTRFRRGLGMVLTASFAAAYVLVSAGIELDLATATRPRLAAWVPAPLRQQSLITYAKQLILDGQPANVLPLATDLVKRDPLSPQAAGLLGSGLLARGASTEAARAFRISARLGWRDAATQVFWFEAALHGGDMTRAGLRFEAIARQWPAAAAIDQLTTSLKDQPGGKAALARRIALGAEWSISYATPRSLQPIDQLSDRAEVLIAAGKHGKKLGCDAIAPLVATLNEQAPHLANELWISQCPDAALPGQLADGDFEASPASRPTTAFEWNFPGNGGLEATIVGPVGNRHLRLHNSSASLMPVAAQRLVLVPRRYRISWQETGTSTPRLAASLSCQAERSATNPRFGIGSSAIRTAMVAAPAECQAPLLQLWLSPGEGIVSIDHVTIVAR